MSIPKEVGDGAALLRDLLRNSAWPSSDPRWQLVESWCDLLVRLTSAPQSENAIDSDDVSRLLQMHLPRLESEITEGRGGYQGRRIAMEARELIREALTMLAARSSPPTGRNEQGGQK